MKQNYLRLVLFFTVVLSSGFSLIAQPLADANDDAVSVATGDIQTVIVNVLANDSLYGFPANLTNIVLTPITSSSPGIELSTDGSVNITQAGLAVGSYTLTYQICDIATLTVCDTAVITVFIGICMVDAPVVAEQVYIYCNSIAPVTISNLPAASTWTVSISKDGVFLTTLSGVGTSTTSIFITSPGVYTFYISNDGNGCMSPQAQLVATAQICGLQLFYTGNYSDFNANNLIDAGDTINYTLSVFNTGNSPVSNINISSPNMNISGPEIPMLNSGASANNSFAGIHVITQNEIDAQEVTTTATATAVMNGETVSSSYSLTKFVGIVGGIRLSAFIDTNENGIQDFGEIHCPLGKFIYEKNNSGNAISLFNNNNNVIIDNNPANSYDISFTIDGLYAPYYSVVIPSYNNITVPAGSGITHYRFPVTAAPYNDLSVNLQCGTFAPVPGSPYSNTITIRNMSYQTVASGAVTFTKDSALTITQTTPADTMLNANGFVYNFTNLGPFQTQVIGIEMQVAPIPIVELGQLITNTATVASTMSEIDYTNNNADYSAVIVGSYDPNDKTESHGGKILHSAFTADDYLTYTIRFENTGTAPALNVRITDVLDSKLDENTVRMVDASHDYIAEQIGNSLTWKFNAINLPPSIADTNTGHGYIVFQVKPKSGYAVGDIIPNTAEIYFDFNPAIVTNTFESKFVETLSNVAFESSSVACYPNPTNGIVYFNTETDAIERIQIADQLGKILLLTQPDSKQATLDLRGWATGIYFAKMNTTKGSRTFKIIKQ